MLYTILCLLVFGITFLTQKGATYYISDELSIVAYTVGFVLADIPLLWMEHFPVTRVFGLSGAMSLLIGALMGIGSLTLFAAYRYGKASVVTPYSQLFPIITVLAGVPLYGEQIDVVRAIGILAALAAGVILTFERQEKTELAQEQTALGD
jgi:drug/metabolite transporter (DMT)-like permease